MKSYKEINEELTLSKELKQETIQKMTASRKHGVIFKYAFVASCLLIGVISSSYFALYDSNEKSDNSHNVFNLKDYISTGVNNEIGSGSLSIAGRVDPISETFKEQIKYITPEESKLVYPQGYDTMVEYGQYVYEDEYINIGPYPVVNYYGGKDDEYKIYFTITHEKMPLCMRRVPRNDENLQSYMNYRLSITHKEDENGNDLYWFVAYRDDYYIEGTAFVEQPEDFENFLRSFLLP